MKKKKNPLICAIIAYGKDFLVSIRKGFQSQYDEIARFIHTYGEGIIFATIYLAFVLLVGVFIYNFDRL